MLSSGAAAPGTSKLLVLNGKHHVFVHPQGLESPGTHGMLLFGWCLPVSSVYFACWALSSSLEWELGLMCCPSHTSGEGLSLQLGKFSLRAVEAPGAIG